MKGKRRVRGIVNVMEKAGFMSREQLQSLFFRFPSGTQKACQVLKRMADASMLKRKRGSAFEPFIYYTGRWSRKALHHVAVNWVYCHYYDEISRFDREHVCGNRLLIADALMITKSGDVYFVEADRGTNTFNKFELYTDYYLSKGWTTKWWAEKYLKTEDGFYFPSVLVATTRKASLDKQERRDNTEGLDFRIMDIETLIPSRRDLHGRRKA